MLMEKLRFIPHSLQRKTEPSEKFEKFVRTDSLRGEKDE
jgi:hypothetical protein